MTENMDRIQQLERTNVCILNENARLNSELVHTRENAAQELKNFRQSYEQKVNYYDQCFMNEKMKYKELEKELAVYVAEVKSKWKLINQKQERIEEQKEKIAKLQSTVDLYHLKARIGVVYQSDDVNGQIDKMYRDKEMAELKININYLELTNQRRANMLDKISDHNKKLAQENVELKKKMEDPWWFISMDQRIIMGEDTYVKVSR